MSASTTSKYELENNYTDTGVTGGNSATAWGSGNSFSTGKVGSYALFTNGSGGAYVTTPTGIATGNTDISFSFWMYVNTTPASGTYKTFFGVGDVGVSNGQVRVWYDNATGGPHLVFTTGSNFTYTVTLTTGTWYHVACSYKASTKAATMWLNDSVVASGTAAANLNLTLSGGTLKHISIMNDGQSAGSGCPDGGIDDIRIYSGYVFTQSDVDYIYNGGAGTSSEIGTVIANTNQGFFALGA